MTTDDKPPPPDGKPTVAMPAMTDRALLEDLARTAKSTGAVVDRLEGSVGRLEGSVDGLIVDGRDLHGRINRIESRLDRIEMPSSMPPKPLTSSRVQAIIDEHPSQMDLEVQSKLADLIVQHAKEKAELEAKVVTKEDVKNVVKEATAAQTVALVTEISQNKKLRVIAGLVAAIVIGWLGRTALPASAPVAVPPAITVPK